MKEKNQINNFRDTAVWVSTVSIVSNVILSLLKLLAGVFAHSGAMISDAVHSASDVFSSIVVIIGVRLASRESDKEHPYGHERMECVAAIILAVILCITGILIGYNALGQLTSGNLTALPIPGVMALVAAIVSIVVKEAMYWYTRRYAKLLDSGALMADAWHHRSDALSSVGALIGIGGARMGYLWLDAAASLVICVFVVKAAYDIFIDAIQKMVDHSCGDELEKEIIDCVVRNPGVVEVHQMIIREFGNRIYVDLEIHADGQLTLNQANSIADQVHDGIEAQFPKIKHISVRVSPQHTSA